MKEPPKRDYFVIVVYVIMSAILGYIAVDLFPSLRDTIKGIIR